MNNIIGVFGSSIPVEGEPEYETAYKLGKELGKNGFGVCTGGYQGIMNAVSKGVNEEGNQVIGITVNNKWKASPSKYLTKEIKTNSLLERLDKLLNLPSGFVLLNGGTGTMVELALVWEYLNKNLMENKPVVCLGDMWQEIVEVIEKRIVVEKRKTGLIHLANSIDETIQILKTKCCNL